MKFNNDLMINADHEQVAMTSFAVIDLLQDLDPELQALALAATFKLLAERFNLNPQDVFTYAGNLMTHTDGTHRSEFKGIRMYLREEL